jgi:uncharacterized membrane protein (UPF0127 family)
MRQIAASFQSLSGESINLTVKVTETFYERNRGLLALSALEESQGLLITPCRSVHTFNMRYALDIVYLNKKNKIIKIVKNMKPNRISYSLKAKRTLELKSGEVARLQLNIGMQGIF